MAWLKESLNVFAHWVSFGIVASILPFLIFVDLTTEDLSDGAIRVIKDAAINGDLVLALIPIVGALIGETVARKFWSNLLETITSIIGICLFVYLIGFASDHRFIKPEDLTIERKEMILNNTELLFYWITGYALAVMFVSSVDKTK